MGLVIVFLDVGSNGWDWIADPIGWVLVLLGLAPVKERLPGYAGVAVAGWFCLLVSVLIFPPGSVDSIDESLGWLFSLPTIAFCFLLSDALADCTPRSLALRFRWLRVVFVVVGVLPFLVFVIGWDWLTIPAAVVAVLTNVVLVLTVWAAGDEPEELGGADTLAALRSRQRAKEKDGARSTPPAPDRASPEPVEPPKARRKKEPGFDAEAVKRRARQARGD